MHGSLGRRGLPGKWFAAIELALIAIGATCVGWYGGVHVAAAREQTILAHELEIAPGAQTVAGARRVSVLAPRSVIARIEIPRLNLSAVAREGVDDGTLCVAAGHFPGTALPGEAGNAAFAAHRDTFFRPLRSVHDGDVVLVTAPSGRYRYRITSAHVVEPDDVSVLDPTASGTLTLITCYPFNYVGSAPDRFIVRGVLLPR